MARRCDFGFGSSLTGSSDSGRNTSVGRALNGPRPSADTLAAASVAGSTAVFVVTQAGVSALAGNPTEALASFALFLTGTLTDDRESWRLRTADGNRIELQELPLRAALDRRAPVERVILCGDSNEFGRLVVAVGAVSLPAATSAARDLVVTITDVTPLARVERAKEVIGALGELLATSLDFEPTLTRAARLFVPTLADWCTIDIVAEDASEAMHRLAVAHRREEREPLLREPARPDAVVGVPWAAVRAVMHSGRAELRERVPASLTARGSPGRLYTPPGESDFGDLTPRSYLCVPLAARGRCFGVLSLATSMEGSGRRLDTHDLELAEDLASRLALAVHDRPQTTEHEMRWAAELATLRATRLQLLTATLAELQTVDDVARVSLEHVTAATGAHAGSISLLRDGGTTLRLERAHGYPPGLIERIEHIPVAAQSPLAVAVRTGDMIWLQSHDALAAAYPHLLSESTTLTATEAHVSVPLMVERRAIGVLGLGFPQPRSPNDQERAFVLALARESGRALERARVGEAEHRASAEVAADARRLAFLASASDVLGRSLDYRKTVANVVALAVPTLADACVVYALEPNGELRQSDVAHQNVEGEPVLLELLQRDALHPGSGSILLEAIRTGEPQVIEEMTDAMLRAAARDSGQFRNFVALGVSALMAFPLVAHDRALGVIAFVALSSARRYDADDVLLAGQLAERAAVAIENSQRYRSSQEVKDAQTEFMTLLSRDLRTPLTSIGGYAELLLLGIPEPLPEAARAQVERVQRASQQLLALIESISRALPEDAPETSE